MITQEYTRKIFKKNAGLFILFAFVGLVMTALMPMMNAYSVNVTDYIVGINGDIYLGLRDKMIKCMKNDVKEYKLPEIGEYNILINGDEIKIVYNDGGIYNFDEDNSEFNAVKDDISFVEKNINRLYYGENGKRYRCNDTLNIARIYEWEGTPSLRYISEGYEWIIAFLLMALLATALIVIILVRMGYMMYNNYIKKHM